MIKYWENFEEFALIRIFLKTFKENCKNRWQESGQAKEMMKIISTIQIYVAFQFHIFVVQTFNILVEGNKGILCQGSKFGYTKSAVIKNVQTMKVRQLQKHLEVFKNFAIKYQTIS